MGKGHGRRNEEKNDHGSIHPQSKELWCVHQSTASDGREEREWGKTAQPSPAAQLQRAQDPGPRIREMLVAQWVCRQAGQAGRQAVRATQVGR